jgi:two-component system NtrC family sensor kinase
VIGYAGISEDLTRRKELEEELVQREKLSALGELVSAVAHELNNPLTAVLGYAEIIQQFNSPKQLEDDIARLYKEAVRCKHMVKNLLGFARKPKPEKTPVDIHTIIRDTINLKTHQFKSDRVDVHTSFDPRMPEIMLDPYQMQQVFLNILNNAHQALTEKKGDRNIWIESRLDGDGIILTISNNGPYIRKDAINKIFEPFYSTKEIGYGTGLGLSICRGIIRSHKGIIGATSRPGGKTTFTIELPIG